MRHTGNAASSHWKHLEKCHCSHYLLEYCARLSHSSPKIELSALRGTVCSMYKQRSSLPARNMTLLNFSFFYFNIGCSVSSGFQALKDLNISLKIALPSSLTCSKTWKCTAMFLCILRFYKIYQIHLQDLTSPNITIKLSEVVHFQKNHQNISIIIIYGIYVFLIQCS